MGRITIIILLATAGMLLGVRASHAGAYLSSAHGSTSYGVSRSGIDQYTQGHCAHCHEQHSSIGGDEPTPTGGPSPYLLFSENSVSQTDNFCYGCHVAVGGYQVGAVTNNLSYSYTFGGNTANYDTDIKDAFGHLTTGSSHHLPSIASQMLGTAKVDINGNAWTLPADLNPCDACHNPHLAQRNAPVSIQSQLLKTAISRPSDHENLWGDDDTERMDATGMYQAPYWFGSTTRYEPDNDTTADGSNLPDFATYCTDCHNKDNTIYSSNPCLEDGPRNLRNVDWTDSGDKHGGNDGSPIELQAPYLAKLPTNIILSCTDCHEPHGSVTNIFLLRTTINGVAASMPDETNTSYINICTSRCHGAGVLGDARHRKTSKACNECHRHGDGHF
ncbi:MAG: hypothetical protein AB7E47_00700 [Desulfovibrionaceae bacterium]